jgi:hypothetical protein
VLLRGFRFDRDSFIGLSDACCPEFSQYVGGGFRFRALDRVAFGAGGTLLSVTGDTQSFSIPLHGEMYYQSERPDVLWFYCEQPAEQAGETTVADGRELFRRLSRHVQQTFRDRKLRYVRELADGDWQVMFRTHNRDDVRSFCERSAMQFEAISDGSIRTDYTSPAIHSDMNGDEVFINSALILWAFERALCSGRAPSIAGLDRQGVRPPLFVRQEDGSPLCDAWVEEVERIAEEIRLKVAWQRGDVLAVDNSWVLHVRRKAVGEGRMILVRLGYLPNSPFTPRAGTSPS